MTTMVCFYAGETAYCVSVDATRGVRTTAGLMALPRPRRGVTGVIPGDPPLTVISPLGRGGAHILILDTATKTFGLLVDAVTSLCQIEGTMIGPPPEGQSRPLISGTLERDGQLLLIADAQALGGLL